MAARRPRRTERAVHARLRLRERLACQRALRRPTRATRPHARFGRRGDAAAMTERSTSAARSSAAASAGSASAPTRRSARSTARRSSPPTWDPAGDPLLGTSDRRALRGRRRPRRRGHGDRLRGPPHRARSRLRDEGAAARSRARPGPRRALHARGEGDGEREAPEHRRDHRLRAAARRRLPVLRDGAPRRPDARRARSRAAGAIPAARGVRIVLKVAGALAAAHAGGDRSSRSEARQRLPRRRRAASPGRRRRARRRLRRGA